MEKKVRVDNVHFVYTPKPKVVKEVLMKPEVMEKAVIYHDIDFYGGGYTGVAIVDEVNPNMVKIGVAICSERDNFSKKLGRELAYKRIEEGKYFVYNSVYDFNTNRSELFRDVRTFMKYGKLDAKYLFKFAKKLGEAE